MKELNQKKQKINITINQTGNPLRERQGIYEFFALSTNFIFQFIPILVMVIIQSVSSIQFKQEEYTTNLVLSSMMVSATTLFERYVNDRVWINDLTGHISSFINVIIVCLSSILYCILLLSNDFIVGEVSINTDVIMWIAIFFLGIVYMINIWIILVKGKRRR